MVDWHPIQAAKQCGPNEWEVWSGRTTDSPKGVIRRIEFGLFREVWFRAVVTEGESGGREILGWCRTAERAAELIWAVPLSDSHNRPAAGYPSHSVPRERRRDRR